MSYVLYWDKLFFDLLHVNGFCIQLQSQGNLAATSIVWVRLYCVFSQELGVVLIINSYTFYMPY